MGFVLQASCPKCKYHSRKLIIGDGVNFIFVCENCHSVVNLQQIPFRYTWSTCPNCKNLLYGPAWVDGAHLAISRHEPIESAYQCPRCKKHPLSFEEIAHFTCGFDERVPEIGMLVHGRFAESGELEIPFLIKSYCAAHLENVPASAPNKIMELRVTRVEPKPADEKSQLSLGKDIFLEFVRYVSQADLEQESRKQPTFKSKTREFLEANGLFADEK